MEQDGKIPLSTWYQAMSVCAGAEKNEDLCTKSADSKHLEVQKMDADLQCEWTMKPQSAVPIPDGTGDYKPVPSPRLSKRCAVGAKSVQDTRLTKI